MIRRKLKSMCGLTLALVLAANMTPVVSYAVTGGADNVDKSITRESKIDSSYLRKDEVEIPENKIVEGIDVESQEEISVIVEFVSPSIAEGASNSGEVKSFAESKVERDHRTFNEFLDSMPETYNSTGDTSIKYSYKEVFNGVSLTIPGSEVKNLINCPVVKRVHPDSTVQVEIPEKLEFNEEGVKNLPEGKMMDSVPHIGVEDLHEENITGEGIKVGVLDTGIDYNHPDLTNVYKGFRGEHGDSNSQDIDSTLGWDFINNDADPMETTYEDWLESDEPEINANGNSYYTSHGTHVSGTIAGQAENTENNMAVKGVAPGVELYGYRVLGKYGSGATSGIIAAVEKSVKDGMDVINMSLGSSNGTPFDPLVTAVNNASMAGVVTVISNGNAGPNAVTVGSPGTAQLPIAVGASTTPTKFEEIELEINAGTKLSTANQVVKDFDKGLEENYGVSYEAVYCGLGYESDFEGKDLTGKVALVDRGDITFVEKARNAKNAGAEFTIIMNNTTANEIPNQGEHKAGNAIALNQAEGEALKNTLNQDGITNITLNKLSDGILKGDDITGFSSAGPVRNTDEIRPDIVAPGYQTFSTVPEFINDKNLDVDDYSAAYGRMSGTSMAAPHIAGVAALILQENPDYTPADVKAVMMNTSENLNQFREDEYSVHQQGAGRVNAYEAVHEETHITANYKVYDGIDNRELDNESGLISFGKFNKEEENPENKSKIVPLTIENNSDSEKTYNISVKYSESDRAINAEENGVSIDIENSITVAPRSKVTLDATLNIEGAAKTGIYEGYILVVDSGSQKDYQLPFSASYKNSGFDNITYPEMQGGFAKGITSMTSSNLFNRDISQSNLFADIEVAVQVNEPISKIYGFVKDKDTGEYLGYAGGDMDTSWIPMGVPAVISGLVPNGRVQKLKGENITNEHILLDEGVYELELVGVRGDGSTFKGNIPMGIINDADENKMTLNFEPGVTEITEEDYTTETWADGNDYEGIWMKGNISHPIVEELKVNHGMDYLEQSEVNFPSFTYVLGSGLNVNLGAWAKQDGEFLLAGIEKSDLESGPFVVEGKSINTGKIGSTPEAYIFINEGESYLELKMNKDTVKVGDEVVGQLTLNNVEDLSKGSFEILNYGNAIFDIVDIKPTEELQEYLNKNNNSIEINFEKREGDFNTQNKHFVSFEINGENVVGINGDIPLFDVTYNLSKLRGIMDNEYPIGMFAESTFSCKNSEFKNSNDEVLNVSVETVKDYVDFIDQEKTRVYGTVATVGFESQDVEVYALDSEGNKYEPEYEGNYRYERTFIFNNLPVIDGEYRVFVDMPGHFGAIANIAGGELKNGELVGTQVHLGSDSFFARPLMGVAGDANEDGAIDMHDVNKVMNQFDKEVVNTPGNSPDFNQDGVVDLEDFISLYENYGKQDFNRDDSKVPELIIDGKDIIDVLEELGIFENGEGFGINLDSDVIESFERETVTFTANPEYDPGYYKFRFYTRKEGEVDWTLSREESGDNVFEWVPESAGKYEVRVRAIHPSGQEIQDTITHTVESLDSIIVSPLSNFRATNIEKKNVTVEWNAPENTKGLRGYVLYKDGKKVGEIGTNETSYTFKGLNRHTIYNFKVAAKYANGELSTKETLTLRTKR
ncbi:S8 family serine peptidase [Clostridium sp. B9]|uniref:S8 family serine peptidase n=1 Tax=Clostridium sp. B9 TaxID=3423224 RepID=UPI003D2F2703